MGFEYYHAVKYLKPMFPKLAAVRVLVLQALAVRCNSDTLECNPSHALLLADSYRSTASRATVKRDLDFLRGCKLIDWDESNGMRCAFSYRLLFPAVRESYGEDPIFYWPEKGKKWHECKRCPSTPVSGLLKASPIFLRDDISSIDTTTDVASIDTTTDVASTDYTKEIRKKRKEYNNTDNRNSVPGNKPGSAPRAEIFCPGGKPAVKAGNLKPATYTREVFLKLAADIYAKELDEVNAAGMTIKSVDWPMAEATVLHGIWSKKGFPKNTLCLLRSKIRNFITSGDPSWIMKGEREQ